MSCSQRKPQKSKEINRVPALLLHGIEPKTIRVKAKTKELPRITIALLVFN
jgi:hypothetical protein